MQAATHPPQSTPKMSFIDLTVRDADFRPTDSPYISNIHTWYWHAGDEGDRAKLQQISACGHSFLNYLRNVVGQCYDTLTDYWHTVDPDTRDKAVEEFLEYRVNSLLN